MLSAQSQNAAHPKPEEYALIAGKILSEKTLDDGNCAFNAFILALIQPAVLDYLESECKNNKALQKNIDVFLKYACGLLNIDTVDWPHFKAAALSLREKDKTALQTILAPLFRAIALSKAQYDDEYKAAVTKLVSVAALNDFLANEIKPESEDIVQDEVLRTNPFIQEKFLEICRESLGEEADEEFVKFKILKDETAELNLQIIANTDDMPADSETLKQAIEALEHNKEKLKQTSESLAKKFATKQTDIAKAFNTWWQKEGFFKFCETMRTSAEWAGDIELKRLARFFDLHLVAQKVENNKISPVEIYANKPAFPKQKVKKEILQELLNANIITYDSESDHFYFASDLSMAALTEESQNLSDEASSVVQGLVMAHPNFSTRGPRLILVNTDANHWRNVVNQPEKKLTKDLKDPPMAPEPVLEEATPEIKTASEPKPEIKSDTETKEETTAWKKKSEPTLKGADLGILKKPVASEIPAVTTSTIEVADTHATPVTKPGVTIGSTPPEKTSVTPPPTMPSPAITKKPTAKDPTPKPTPEPKTPAFSKDLPKDVEAFFKREEFIHAKEILTSAGWTLHEYKGPEVGLRSKVFKPKNPADKTGAAGKYAFNIYVNKLTTTDDESETFIMMLRTFQELHGTGKFPKITTHDEDAKGKWIEALKIIYPDKAEAELGKFVTISTAQPEKAPAPPAPPIEEPVTSPKI